MTPDQYQQYQRQGFVFCPGLLPTELINEIVNAIPRLCEMNRPEVIFEKDGKTVRSLMNVHTFCDAVDQLIHLPDIVSPAREMIGSDFYIFQCILNLKKAFSGDIWQWHQDLPTYLTDDGMPANRLVNVLIFLEQVTEFNGALMLVPGSHNEEAMRNEVDDTTTSYPIRALDNERVAEQIAKGGIDAPKGPPGSVIFANTNIIHGSGPNLSPWGRAMISLTLNSVDNKHTGSTRPGWVVMDDFTPVVAIDP